MPSTSLTSDININPSIFAPASTSNETAEFVQKLYKLGASGPKWYEVGAAKYRAMRKAGETPLPKAVVLDKGRAFQVPSRDQGRSIPCRVMAPEDPSKPISGVFAHFHGGGWVLSDENSQDLYLEMLAESNNLVVISIGYSLAPENPFPAGPHDGYDALSWLVDNAQTSLGAPLKFIGGESAGAHIVALAVEKLLQTRPKDHSLRGVILNAGVYDLSLLPQVHNFSSRTDGKLLILDKDLLGHYLEAFVPSDHKDAASLKQAHISPLYYDFVGVGKSDADIPPALVTIGTNDPLQDDSINMFVKWQEMVQQQPHRKAEHTIIKIFPGEAHGFTIFDGRNGGYSGAQKSWKIIAQYIGERLQD